MRGTVTSAPVISARSSIQWRNRAGNSGISTGRKRLSGWLLAANADSMPLKGPHPGWRSGTTGAWDDRSVRAPAIRGAATPMLRSLSRATSTRGRPPTWSRALSRPIRVLRPPASTNPSTPSDQTLSRPLIMGGPHLACFSRDVGFHCSFHLTLDLPDALSGQPQRYPTSREKQARCGPPVICEGTTLLGNMALTPPQLFKKQNDRLNPPIKIGDVELLIRRMQVVVRQPKAHHHRGNLQVPFEISHDRNRPA